MEESKLPPFKFCDDPTSAGPKWTKWKRSFNLWALGRAELNDAVVKRAKFLSKAGTEVQDVFFQLVGDIDITQPPAMVPGAAAAPDAFDQMMAVLDAYFLPKTNVPYETEVFRALTMNSGEQVDAFVARLREQASRCEFADLRRELRDQLLKGVPWAEVRKDCYKKAMSGPLSLEDVQQEARLHQRAEQQSEVRPPDVSKLSINKGSDNRKCFRCNGKGHFAKSSTCPAWGKKCKICSGMNHLDVACRSKGKAKSDDNDNSSPKKKKNRGKGKDTVRNLREESEEEEDSESGDEDSEEEEPNKEGPNFAFMISSNTSLNDPEATVKVKVGGADLDMLVDSGSRKVNTIPIKWWKKLKSTGVQGTYVEEKDKSVFNYGGDDHLNIVGKLLADVEACNGKKISNVRFRIVDMEKNVVPIMSRVLAMELGFLKIDIKGGLINAVSEEDKEKKEEPTDKVKGKYHLAPIQVSELKQTFPSVFSGQIGKYNGGDVEIFTKEDCNPVVKRLRPVPVGRREPMKKCLDEWLENDVIEPASGPTTWVSLPHLVPKKKEGWRMVVDLRSVNEVLLREVYPIPTREEMVAKISANSLFSSLDFKWCYLQFTLNEKVRHLTTFVTPFGMFRFKRLTFGLSVAAEICQKTMENMKKEVIKNIPQDTKEKVVKKLSEEGKVMEDCFLIFIDDWLIHCKNVWVHNVLVWNAVQTIQKKGMTLNYEKTSIGKTEMDFVGCKLTCEGYQPLNESVKTVQDFRSPANKTELHSFIGLVTYFSIFIPDFATLTAPLRRLLKEKVTYDWKSEQQEAFETLKLKIVSKPVLGYFDPKAPTLVFADASPVGLGCLLVQYQQNKPVAIKYASYALSEVEQRYSQTEKEAYALVFACEKLQFYLLGRQFKLITDHKPLTFIFNNHAKTKVAGMRVSRWALRLQEFQFSIEYRVGKSNLADPFSRLLPTGQAKEVRSRAADEEKQILQLLEERVPAAMTLETIRQATGEDEELQLVIKSLRSGRWPKELSAYQLLEPQLAECNGLLAKEDKIVIPKSLQLQVLILAHEGHLGITATKQTLRLKVWWMGVDKCVEDFVATCFGCQLINKNFTPEPLVSTPMPAHAWEYMGVDYFSFKTYHLLVMVDYFSRYLKVEIAKDESAKSTIQILEKVFWEWGRPEKLASDNGPCFEAREFQEFLRTWGVVHVHASALWPQANGEVERQNRNLLKRLQIAQGTKSEWTRELWTYVHAYNNTPHGTTGVPPAQLFFSKRPLLTKLPLLDKSKEAKWCMEEVREREALNKWKSKSYADKKRHAEKSGIQVGDQVLRKNENRNNKTDPPRDPDPATVIHRQGSSVVVKTPTGNVLERNVSFFSPLKTPVQAKQDSNNNTESVEKSPSGTLGEDRPQKTAETPRPSGSPKTGEGVGQEQKMTETPKKSGEGPRRGGRLRQRPLYFKDFVTG